MSGENEGLQSEQVSAYAHLHQYTHENAFEHPINEWASGIAYIRPK